MTELIEPYKLCYLNKRLKLSNVKPHRSIRSNSCEWDPTPHRLVCSMSVGRALEFLEVLCWGQGGKQLLSVFVEIDLMKHKLTCLFQVGKLVNQSEIIGSNILVEADSWAVWHWVFVFCIAPVKNALDLALDDAVHALIFEIMGDPASVNQYSAFLSVGIKVSIEWCDYLHTLLSSIEFLYLDLSSIVKNSPEHNWLHWPLLLEFIDVFSVSPDVRATVLRCDVNGLFGKEFSSSLRFLLFVILQSLLVLRELVNKHCHNKKI
jgi:hypothetical protein